MAKIIMTIQRCGILILLVVSAQSFGFADALPPKKSAPVIVLSPNVALQLLDHSLRSSSRAKAKEEIVKKYQQIYNIPDQFMVKDGYVADTSALDGPVRYGFTASALKAGYYIFTFQHRNRVGFMFEVRKVTLFVISDKDNREATARRATISPVDTVWNTYKQGTIRANLNDDIVVEWFYHNSRGIPGGWELTTVEFTDSILSNPQLHK